MTGEYASETEYAGRCDSCGGARSEEPLRSIKMRHGDRELLCEPCFEEAVEEGRVSPLDPRLPGENA